MPILHRVREHLRKKDTHVDSYQRGSGDARNPYHGGYSGSSTMTSKAPSASIRQRLQKAIDEARLRREIANAQRAKANAEAKGEIDAARAKARYEAIQEQERIRAREGGRFRRTGRGLSRIVFHAGYRKVGGKKIVKRYRAYESKARRPIRGDKKTQRRKRIKGRDQD